MDLRSFSYFSASVAPHRGQPWQSVILGGNPPGNLRSSVDQRDADSNPGLQDTTKESPLSLRVSVMCRRGGGVRKLDEEEEEIRGEGEGKEVCEGRMGGRGRERK